MRHCVGITAFEGLDQLRETIRRVDKYSPEDTEIAIWDNSPPEYRDIEKYSKRWDFENIQYLSSNENIGQTGSKNKLVEYFMSRYPDITYLMLIDQDMLCNYGYYEELRRIVETYEETGIISFMESLNIETNTGLHPRYPTRDLNCYITSDIPGGFWYLNAKVFAEVGGFNEKLFFHSYDSEYCQKMQYNTGYKIYLSAQEGFITHNAHYTARNFSKQRADMIRKDLSVWHEIQKEKGYWYVPDIRV